ncbi:hypothetical protein GCM10009609_65880 [Pseudonocardia aurantiaca]|uniref:Ferredoxin n=1 Tax=Pseudonocardia aurantiaca TaxID=75290 RepID=A0ABW4FTP2_9PSEU
MRVSADQDLCVGSGKCVQTSGEVFDQGEEDGVVVVLQHTPSEQHHEAARRAAHGCPSAAISIIE